MDSVGEGSERTYSAATRTGSIAVRTNAQGVPQSLRIEDAEMRKGAYLAADVLRLCQQAALRADAELREELEERGIPGDLADRSGLISARSLAAQEALAEMEDEDQPQSWLRSI